jgi:CBS domain-containing protein
MMVANDCGEIPICDEARKPIGVVTDRDIVCRLLAKGPDPLEARAKDCMSRPVLTCTPDMSINDCAQLMERHQVRRVPVIDRTGAVCGMVSQADLARKGRSRWPRSC